MKHALFLILIVSFWACQPEADNLRLLDDLVVSTNYDTTANFQAYTTYAIATDTIGLISNRTNDTIMTAGESDFPRPVLAQLKSSLNSLGYAEIPRTEDPDIGINVYVVEDLDLFQQVIYPNYYYPYYYGYSSYYYYPYVATYSYNTGALVVEIVDLKNRTSSNQVKVVWTAYLGDIINTVDRIPQTEEAIQQAFLQSPYLSK